MKFKMTTYFFDVLKSFQTNYGGGTATGEDFQRNS